MKFFRLDLLTLLISLFILNGCKNQDTIGIGPAVPSTTGTLLTDTNVVVNTVPEDSLQTTGLTKVPLAYFKDPVLGTTESNIIALLNLPGSVAYTIPTGTNVIDSAVLVLNYGPGFYGDSIATHYKVNVFQLNARYATNVSYYNTYPWTYNASSLLGTKTFFARPSDSLKIYNIIAGAPDTLYKVKPQIRIPIQTSFINFSLFNAQDIGSNPLFQNLTKGLFVTLDKTGTTGVGGAIMLALDSSRIDVYYRNTNGTTIDTAMTSLMLSNYNTQIKHTYSAAVNAELNNKTTSGKLFYIQGPLGLRAKISFPDLKTIFNSMGGKIVLNRAELVITPQVGTNVPFLPITKISMYKLDIAKQRQELEDANTSNALSGGITTFGGFYSRTQNEYHFIVTDYVQDLMTSKTVDYGTYLGAVDTTNTTSVDFAATPSVASRTIAVGSDKTSPYRIVLNIIYTKTAK